MEAFEKSAIAEALPPWGLFFFLRLIGFLTTVSSMQIEPTPIECLDISTFF